MTVSKQELKNGDVFWVEDDGTMRKVTQDDIADGDYTKVVVYFDGNYFPFWDGMVKVFGAS